MNKRTIVLLAIITMAACRIFAQGLEDKQIREYLMRTENIPKYSQCTFYAYELLTGEPLKPTDTYGIYRIGVDLSDMFEHLMLLKNQEKVFIRRTRLIPMLRTALLFFEEKECPFTGARKLAYIKHIIRFSEQFLRLDPDVARTISIPAMTRIPQ